MSSDLPFQDEFNVSRLKRLRDRSMRNPQWLRDPDHVLAYLTHGVVPTADEKWPEGSALAQELRQAQRRVKDFRRYLRSHPAARRAGADKDGDQLWSQALAAIDSLVGKAEAMKGSRLRQWR